MIAATDLLHRIADGCVLRAVLPPDEHGKKLLLPINPAAIDLAALIAGHVAGRMPPVAILTQDAKTWTERRAVALAACPVRGESAAWFGLDFDAAGHGHATPSSAEDASRGAEVAANILRDAGLHVVLAASTGGKGRHVWAVERMPAGMASWLAGLVRDEVLAAVPGADIEIRPGSDREPGQPMTLPGAGAYRACGGGRILEHETGRPDGISAFRSKWEAVERARAVVERRQEADRLARMDAARGRAGNIDAAGIPLDAVAAALSTITWRRGAELRVRCPRHQGDSALTANVERRVWKCFRCDAGGAGDGAAFSLARFLLNDPPNAEVFAALRAALEVACH